MNLFLINRKEPLFVNQIEKIFAQLRDFDFMLSTSKLNNHSFW